MITLTAAYDPSDPADLSVEALRCRAVGLRRGWRAAWKAFADSSSAAFSSVELSAGGLVHLHALAYCTWVDNEDNGILMTAARKAFPGIGSIRKVSAVEGGESGAVVEVAKYVTKSSGVSSGQWFAGNGLVEGVIHPHLAARWEIALYGMRVSEMHGCARGIDKPAADALLEGEGEPADRGAESCAACGVVGDWWEWSGSVEEWARLCVEYDVRPWGRPYRPPAAVGPPAAVPVKSDRVEQLRWAW